MLELNIAEQFSVVMVVSIVPPATSSSCSSLIVSGLLVSSLILVSQLVVLVLVFGSRTLSSRAQSYGLCLDVGIGQFEVDAEAQDHDV
jgi:hypothetical protein